MKIATFNINNVNKRLANLAAWLRQARPDVACLQELKATDSEFPVTAIKRAGYDAVWRGEKSWNGVAILGRGGEPVLTRHYLRLRNCRADNPRPIPQLKNQIQN
jgi:exodeoxyribonuclease-3